MRCFWKGTSVSRLLQPCWGSVPSWCLLIAGVPVGLSWPGVVGIMGFISSELQCQDTGKENTNLGAAGGRREAVNVLSITCLCILLVRAVWEPKTPTEDGNHGKLSWEMQFLLRHRVWVRSLPSSAGSLGRSRVSRSWGWGRLWAHGSAVFTPLWLLPGGKLALERPVWALEHPLPWIRAGLDPLPVPGPVRECFTVSKTFKWGQSKSKWFQYLMEYIWLNFTFIFYL